MIYRQIFTKACLGLGLVAAPCGASSASQARSVDQGPEGYFVSIDGLNPSLLKVLHDEKQLPAHHGFQWLLDTSRVYDHTWPVITTLTAASHVSTITCTPPSRHGIVANGFIKEGKKVSGFSEAFNTEPLWSAAARQGKKVVSLAYAGADGSTPARTADFGLSYPSDQLLGPSQLLEWPVDTLVTATGWTLNADTSKATNLKEADVTIVLNPKTTESRVVHVLIDLTDANAAKYYLDNDKDLTNGLIGSLAAADQNRPTLDAFWTEENPASTVPGVKRRAFFRTLPADAGKLALYVSKASYNNANPASFRHRLDELNLVWPDYGVRSPKLTGAEWVDAQAMIDRFLTQVAVQVVPELDVDIVLFYQPLIDSIGHKYQSALPLPFDPHATDDVTKVFVKGFQIVDANISRIFGAARKDVAIALMGDHGMDPIKKVVNLAPLMPTDHVGKVEVVASGSLTMLYPPMTTDGGTDAERAAAVDAIAASLKDKLQALTFNGEVVFDGMLNKTDTQATPNADYRLEWQYGEALHALSSKSGYWFMYNPLEPAIFLDPPALGMHGNFLDVPTIATNLIVHAKGIRPEHRPDASLIDAVPTFAALIGIEPPRDCLGHSLLGNKGRTK